MIDSGQAPLEGIRTRAVRREHYCVADRKPDNAFVHIIVRMREGRPKEAYQKVGEMILAAAEKSLEKTLAEASDAARARNARDHPAHLPQGHAAQGREGGMSTTLDDDHRARGGLSRPLPQGRGRHLIDGKPDAGSGETFETASPVDNAVIAKVARGGAADIDRAAKAATKAFRTGWGHTSGEKRRAILHKIADAIEARADEIAFVECMDTGQPIRYMSKAALRGAENFRFYADRAPNAADGLSLPTETHLNYTMRQPIGPVGVITPWNTPFMLSTWKIAPALAAGCTVVHKPAEWSPAHRHAAGRDLPGSRTCRRACSMSCTASARMPAAR